MEIGVLTTVRELCAKAGIGPKEAKFVNCALCNEVKKGRAEKLPKIKCPVTNRLAHPFRLIIAAGARAPRPKRVDPGAGAAANPVVNYSSLKGGACKKETTCKLS